MISNSSTLKREKIVPASVALKLCSQGWLPLLQSLLYQCLLFSLRKNSYSGCHSLLLLKRHLTRESRPEQPQISRHISPPIIP